MKLAKVILKPERTTKLRDALSGLGYHGITTKEILGYGEQKLTIKKIYRGKIYEQRAGTIRRTELEFVVSDCRLEKVIETIRSIAETGQGDDKHLGDSSETGFKAMHKDL